MAQAEQQSKVAGEDIHDHSAHMKDADAVQGSLALAVDLVTQVAEAGSDLAGLIEQEVRLAFGDALRLIVLYRVFVYLLVLAWIGLSLSIAWVAYDLFAYGPGAALVFTLLQVAGLLMIRFVMQNLRENLSLPRTREQLNTLMGGDGDKTPAAAE